MSLKATILDTKPETVYQNTVYEQVVVIKLTNSKQLGAFDDDMVISHDSVGDDMKINVSLLPSSKEIEVIDHTEKRIKPNPDVPLHYKNHEYYGQVQRLEDETAETYRAELDIGVGTVLLFPFKEYNEDLTEGEYIRIEADRTDISSRSR